MRVAVLGSLHMDVVVRAPRLPVRDETLMGSAWEARPGGKGGNQAVAAARMGAAVAFVGAVGDDGWGRALRAHLEGAGVDVSGVVVDPSRGSGMSVAIEEAGGAYAAVVVSGANLGVAGDVGACDVLLLQNEVPEGANVAAARLARRQGATVVLNAAPARAVSAEMMGMVDVLVVNRVEAEMLAEGALSVVHALGGPSRDVVLTRGAEGVTLLSRDGREEAFAAHPVRAVSAHGAGDAFCGALAASLAGGAPLAGAGHFARAGAAVQVALGPRGVAGDVGAWDVLLLENVGPEGRAGLSAANVLGLLNPGPAPA